MTLTVEAVSSRRRVFIEFDEQQPRVGRPLRGRFVLDRWVKEGDVFVAGLTCRRDYYVFDLDENREAATDQAYEQRVPLKATGDSGKWVVPFEFDLRATDPPSGIGGDDDDDDGYIWRMSLQGVDINSAYKEVSEFILQIGAAPPDEVRAALTANESPELTAKIDEFVSRSRQFSLPHQRVMLAQKPHLLNAEIQTQQLKDKIERGLFVGCFGVGLGVLVGIPILAIGISALYDLYQRMFVFAP